MSATAKNAILWAYINDVLTQIMVKTGVDNVMVDDTTTLVAKLAEMVTDINEKAKKTEVTTQISNAVNGLAKADDVTAEIKTAIDKLIDGAPGTYDTLKEIADYIAAHEEVVDAINAAIGNKAEKSVVDTLQATVNALGSLANKSTVTESDLDASLKEKVNAAAQGNHSHGNKALLDTYDQTNTDIKAAVTQKHTHSNKTVLDGITAANVTDWNGKARVLVSTTQPADMKKTDFWIQPL